MNDEKKITIEDFLYLFVAISYLHEQRYFNIDNLKEYIKKAFEFDNDVSLALFDEINRVIDKMCNEKIVERKANYNYLVKINDNIPYRQIVSRNSDYLNDVTNFLYAFINYGFLENRYNVELNNKDKNPFNLDKVYIKKKVV